MDRPRPSAAVAYCQSSQGAAKGQPAVVRPEIPVQTEATAESYSVTTLQPRLNEPPERTLED